MKKANSKANPKVSPQRSSPSPTRALAYQNNPDEDERRHWDYHYDQIGVAPGTLVIDEDASPTEITLIDYSATTATRQKLGSPEEAAIHLDSHSISWIDLQGLGNEDVLNRLGSVFNLHPLVLEDVVNVPQRPKVEYYADQVLIITRMVMMAPNSHPHDPEFTSEQLSFVLGKNYLLTVQEELNQDCLDPVRDRIRQNVGRIRSQGADYLAYALLDAVIDAYFPVLETYGEYIESLEDEVIFNPTRQTVQKIYRARRQLMSLRRSIWPQRNALNQLIRDGSSELITAESRVYLQDCYDHVVQVLDIVETYRELTANLMDVYLSSVSNRMNEVMKTLTVISSIFIPLTFIVGVYGMNFNSQTSPWNMPELNAYWGYPICWAVMIAIALALSYYFWHQGWFEDTASKISKS
ncbi:MAG: magnesium and cobalt transport protein CorA [Phormidesmis priestleyi]|uniref:Magnesium transport protein CorA n=1 Tax=Phormidesmis priestleyi TaxID=268141 RepID=A0A2W4ZFP6_9CYAN|nr:MAG: magnesium and cobalt transport protein CorA [Phormidesmis priestleyi]